MRLLLKIETWLLNFGCSNLGWFWFIGSCLVAFVYYRNMATVYLTDQANRLFNKTEKKDAELIKQEANDNAEADRLVEDAKSPRVEADWNK